MISQIAQVGALKQAVESNRVSLQATEAGYEVGTKTAIDVLSSRELLVQAQTNYSQAKYSYLNNMVALRLAAGNLDAATIQQINGWLVQPQPPPPEVPTSIGVPSGPAVAAPTGQSPMPVNPNPQNPSGGASTTRIPPAGTAMPVAPAPGTATPAAPTPRVVAPVSSPRPPPPTGGPEVLPPGAAPSPPSR